MKLIYILLVLLLSGCAVYPAPMSYSVGYTYPSYNYTPYYGGYGYGYYGGYNHGHRY